MGSQLASVAECGGQSCSSDSANVCQTVHLEQTLSEVRFEDPDWSSFEKQVEPSAAAQLLKRETSELFERTRPAGSKATKGHEVQTLEKQAGRRGSTSSIASNTSWEEATLSTTEEDESAWRRRRGKKKCEADKGEGPSRRRKSSVTEKCEKEKVAKAGKGKCKREDEAHRIVREAGCQVLQKGRSCERTQAPDRNVFGNDDSLTTIAEDSDCECAAVPGINTSCLQDLVLEAVDVELVRAAWTMFIYSAGSQQAAGAAIHSKFLEAAPKAQSLFVKPPAAMAMGLMAGLSNICIALDDPPRLKEIVERLSMAHFHLHLKLPAVVLFRDTMLDLFAIELAAEFDPQARECWKRLLNYIGGAIIFVKEQYC